MFELTGALAEAAPSSLERAARRLVQAKIALDQLKDDARALPLLRLALDDDPTHDEALDLLYEIQTARGELASLEEELAKLIDRFEELGDEERAWEARRRLLSLPSHDVTAPLPLVNAADVDEVLPLDPADAESRARLEREARAISSLDHPNICALYDVGQHGDAYFIVMQYLDGQTLAERLTRGPLPIDLALRIAIEIASALEHAHRAGIVHRDLKPANVMLTGSSARGVGTAKLLDFGLAKPQGAILGLGATDETTLGSSPVTAQGVIVGTVRYMAPEQVEGKEADERSDIFAFGVVLHEMITGAPPFDGPTPASIIGSILRDTPPAITERQPQAPAALAHVVATCVAKDPDDRWQSTSDLKRELQWIQSTLGSRAGKPGQPALAGGVSRGWRVAAIAALAAASLLAAALVLARSWMRGPASEIVRFDVPSPPDAPFVGFGASVPTAQFAISPDGRRLVFVAA
ncbi:MAG TPA: protein kinase, partial [Caldimonas sp.]|nr:protein kinase [Caldimonas sp.]